MYTTVVQHTVCNFVEFRRNRNIILKSNNKNDKIRGDHVYFSENNIFITRALILKRNK